LLWGHGGFAQPLPAIPTLRRAIYPDAAGWPQKNGKGASFALAK
jgi:hypothetical protein